MHAILIINQRAGGLQEGRGGVTPDQLCTAFAQAGMPVDVRAAGEHELEAVLREARTERPRAIVIGGGDGTVSAAASQLADTGIPLGVLPLGTLNHFARDLGSPTDWREAVARLARARIRAVDVGAVNDRVFINNCSVGSYAEAVRRRDALQEKHGYGKWLAMFFGIWAVLRNLRRLRVEIRTPDARYERRTPFVFVSNNRYGGQLLETALRERLDEGRLYIYTTRAAGPAGLLRMFWQALARRIDETEGLQILPVTQATITVQGAMPAVACDGEVLPLCPPLNFNVRCRALHVLAPGP